MTRLKTLPTSFSENGFDFNQTYREGPVAFYEKKSQSGTSKTWEVIEIRTGKLHPKSKPQDLADYDLTEIYPSSSQWGLYGFTLTTEEDAVKRAEALKTAIAEREVRA